MHSLQTFLSSLVLSAIASAQTTIQATPHESYSSSVGVLGCKINTNRVAYWPMPIDCTNICVQVTYNSRSVYLLRIDQSNGAHDMSYDAWNYLMTGEGASQKPTTGGATEMTYQNVDASNCASLINTPGGKLPLSASNSMNFVASCLKESGSWVANNYLLYNIADPICSLGYSEPCTLDLNVSNQPSCAHTLGLTTALTTDPVYNIQYSTGNTVLASTNQVVAAAGSSPPKGAPAAPGAPPAAPAVPSAGHPDVKTGPAYLLREMLSDRKRRQERREKSRRDRLEK